MRVLLVNPRMASGWRPYVIPPIGLCSLKASVESQLEDVKVKVLDASGISIEEVRTHIVEYGPDVVGVTTFTEARHNALEVAKIAKELNAGTVTLLGGAHATHTYNQILKAYPFVDVVFLGEGESSLVEFLGNNRGITSYGVKGIAYVGGEGIKSKKGTFVRSLDSLPFPNYDDLDLYRYVDIDGPCKGRPLAAVETSRGCPYNCAFCSSKSVWGNIRFKSVGRVLDELEHLTTDYGYKMVSFVDDIFTVDKKRTTELCEGILNRGLQLDWKCQTRTDRVNKDTLKLMREAGCKLIAFGVESGSNKILGNINKQESKKDILRAFELCREVGIESVFNIIVGSPGETSETLKETRQLIKECKPDKVATAALRAYPGSKIWELGIREGLFTEDVLLTERESIHYEGALTLSQMYRELIKFRILQAQLKGPRGWLELLAMGLKMLQDTPMKLLRGVIGR